MTDYVSGAIECHGVSQPWKECQRLQLICPIMAENSMAVADRVWIEASCVRERRIVQSPRIGQHILA
jgi:hypothetical protein